jgi:hypothetical protein
MVFDWPLDIPDLNPVESVWGWMKRWIQENYPEDTTDLDILRKSIDVDSIVGCRINLTFKSIHLLMVRRPTILIRPSRRYGSRIRAMAKCHFQAVGTARLQDVLRGASTYHHWDDNMISVLSSNSPL